ncbi:MAG: peptidoglycan DD-metalloendopeptidase family protein [Gammaproteobacteria bacterium]|nr:peptidoglycan DD-metalloendopeptidase family protein [Gammaproteobacteria bacterium]
MIFRRIHNISIISLGLLLLTACNTAPFFDGDRTEYLYRHQRFHTVEAGQTLYSIAWTYGYDYRVVAKWNKIKAPYTVKLGQRIRVAPPPEFDTRIASIDKKNSQKDNQKQGKSSSARQYGKKTVNSWSKATKKINWQWPVSGKVVSDSSASRSGRIGINILGDINQPVFAAAGGEVVYSGSGLRGYGKLVIIKHDDVYLSAYAHNNRLLVKEGESINIGQKIATMGNSGTDKVMLHFEIRRDGKPIDPLKQLPRKNL